MAQAGAAARVLIRPATVDDADAIGAVHVRAWQHGYRDQLPDALLDGLEVAARQRTWRERLTAGLEGDQLLLVAEDPDDGHVCGWCSIGALLPDGSADLDPVVVGHLWAINLEPEAWGRGIGSALLGEATARLAARGHAEAILWVLATNERARRFYEREGWAADGAAMTGEKDGVPLDEVRYRRALPAIAAE
jgi:ribosomal protein S18 acetylase RimI-like enzyme